MILDVNFYGEEFLSCKWNLQHKTGGKEAFFSKFMRGYKQKFAGLKSAAATLIHIHGKFRLCAAANGLYLRVSYHICLHWNGNAFFYGGFS